MVNFQLNWEQIRQVYGRSHGSSTEFGGCHLNGAQPMQLATGRGNGI